MALIEIKNLNIQVSCCCEPFGVLFVMGPVVEQDILGPVLEVPLTQLTDTQQVTGTVSFVNKKGNPAPVQDGSVVFASSDPAVLETVVDPASPMTVIVKAKAPGAAQVQCTADADLGDGVKTITLVADFTVVAGEAVGGTISFGTPEEQP